MESWKPKMIPKPSGRFKPNAACKKHPKHRQSPGVCSICLREKLSQLNNSAASSREIKAANNCGSSSSSSSSYISSLSSSDVSSCSSPVVDHRRRMEYSELGRKSMRVFKNNVNRQDLKKSRSMAFHLVRRRKESDDIHHIMDIDHEKRGGFWSKLLPRKKGLMQYSRTMRERVVTAVH